MGQWKRQFSVAIAFVLLLTGMAMPASKTASAQAQPTEGQIIDALTSKKGNTRALRAPPLMNDPKAAEEQAWINSLRARSARSLTVEEREKVADIAKDKPNINLVINFDYNSAAVRPEATSTLLTLGNALSKDGLKGAVFLINGHTDARGSAEYNQDLSERRAEAVKRLLVQHFNLPPTTLIAIGYGKTHLKNSADPLAGENRRVQIVNTEVK